MNDSVVNIRLRKTFIAFLRKYLCHISSLNHDILFILLMPENMGFSFKNLYGHS